MIVKPDWFNEYEVVSKGYTCEFHKKNPMKTYAGCTCCHSWSVKRKKSKKKSVVQSLHTS